MDVDAQTPPPSGRAREVVACIARRRDLVVVSQQRGEPPLSPGERSEAVWRLLASHPDRFLARFGAHVPHELLAHFDELAAMGAAAGLSEQQRAEVLFHLGGLRQTAVAQHWQVRNRRLRYLETVLQPGRDYFSLEEMQARCPYVYHQYIGQHLTPDEVQAQIARETPLPLSHHLLQQMDLKKTRQRQEDFEGFPNGTDSHALERAVEAGIQAQAEAAAAAAAAAAREEEDIEEFDTESEGEGDGNADMGQPGATGTATQGPGGGLDGGGDATEEPEAPPRVSEEERERLREEFGRLMRERFLDGLDADFFDYRLVDGNSKYDDLATLARDQEEAYFEDA